MVATVIRLPPARERGLWQLYDTAVAGRRRNMLIGGAVLVALIMVAGVVAEVAPAKFTANVHRFFSYLYDILPALRWDHLGEDVGEWYWGAKRWLAKLGETLLIAYVGTVLGAAGAFLLCFSASKNLVRSPWLRGAVRRYLEFCRTVPEIVFALIFVVAFGLGPMPGVLALLIHTTGALGKLFSEVVENIDMKPVEGITAAGGSWTERVRYGALPQVLSNFASYTLLRFEINVRSAAVMGFVGAGGIGQDLLEAIRKFYYTDVSAILLLLIAAVMVIDLLTERLRHVLIGLEARS